MDSPSEYEDSFADAFRRATDRGNYKLTDLRNRLASQGLRISLATLSSWRSGARRPVGSDSLQVVDAIEAMLGLPPGELVALVPQPKRFGSVTEPAVPHQEELLRREFLETVAAVGSPPAESTRDLSIRLSTYVGPSGEIERRINSTLLQVIQGKITEMTVVIAAPEPTDLVPAIVDVVGARVARRFQHPGRRLSATVFAFDRTLFEGDTIFWEFTEILPSGYPTEQVAWQGTRRRVKDALIQVIFADGAEPTWCEEYAEFEDGQVVGDPIDVHDGVAHVYRTGFGPGALGIRWGFD